MVFLGFLLLIFLSLFALWAAASLTARLGVAGLGEAATACGLLWTGIVTLPILALGWTNVLYRWSLALAVIVLCIALTLLASIRIGLRPHARNTAALLIRLARSPWDALVQAWRAKSLILISLIGAYAIMLWTAWLSYLAASTSWDGIWYHETIVGFAIQNHGFSLVNLPVGLDYVNSFPRVCEALNLWCVFFTDRRLIELPNTLMSPLFIAATYTIVRRYLDDRLLSLGWATALYLIPGVLLQLRSTYIDLHVAALYLAAACFCARPEFRLRDAWLGALALALLAGSKGHALIWVPPLAGVAFLRLVWQHLLKRPIRLFGTLLGAVALILAVAAPSYIRNWLTFKNPIWPIHFQSETLGITWQGTQRVEDLKRPFDLVLRDALSQPYPGLDFPDLRSFGYGTSIVWLVFPLACVGVLWALGRSVWRWRSPPARSARNLILCVLPLLITAPFSPALWSARYNLHCAAALVFLASAFTALPSLRRLAEGVVAAAGLSSLMQSAWADPGWSVDLAQASELARWNARERASALTTHWGSDPDVALARENEIGEGDTVALTDDFRFPALLWNERFSNRVVYVRGHPSPKFVADLDEERAEWVAVMDGTNAFKAINGRPAQWQRVGPITTNVPAIVAFRRVGR